MSTPDPININDFAAYTGWTGAALAQSGMVTSIGKIVGPNGTLTTNNMLNTTLIIDKSSSMNNRLIISGVITGGNMLIKILRKLEEAFLQILLYNHAVSERHSFEPVRIPVDDLTGDPLPVDQWDVKPLDDSEYRPTGSTASQAALRKALLDHGYLGGVIKTNKKTRGVVNRHLIGWISDGFTNHGTAKDAAEIRQVMKSPFVSERLVVIAFMLATKETTKRFAKELRDSEWYEGSTKVTWTGTDEQAAKVMYEAMCTGYGWCGAETAAEIDSIDDDDLRARARIYKVAEDIIIRSFESSYAMLGGFGIDPKNVFAFIQPDDRRAAAQQIADIIGVALSSSILNFSKGLDPTAGAASGLASTGLNPDPGNGSTSII